MSDERPTSETAQRAGGTRRLIDPRDIPLGAHLVTQRRGYSHHGIYAGDGRVIHYAGFSSGLHRGPVEEVALAAFAAGRPVYIECDARAAYSGAQVAGRARSRLGEDRYRLTTNNCEHFCAWCTRGESRSAQVESIFASPRRAIAFALAVLRQLVSAAPRRQASDSGAA